MAGIRLLIVDDDPEIAAFMRLKLSIEAPLFVIDTVTGGRECLEYERGSKPDCILSDYQMPGMNGMELLEALRAQGDDTPFIFITGQGNEEVAREAFKKGANDYFTKDIGFAHFPRVINSVEQAVRHRLANEERARAEAELVEHKNKLEAMFASIPDGLTMVGPDLTILYQNDKLKEVVGPHAGEKCFSAYHGRDDVCEGCQVERAFEDGVTHTAERVLIKDGRKMYFENTASPVRDASGRIIACLEVVRNITDSKRVEEALRDSEEFLKSVFESIQDGISVLDRELNIIRVNRTVESWYPEKKNLVGRKCYEAFQGRSEPCEDCPSVKTLETGMACQVESLRESRSDGEKEWVELHSFPLLDRETGSVKGVIEYTRDITDRKRYQEELVAVKGRLEMLLAHNPAVIYSCEAGGAFAPTYVSGNVRDNYGYDPEEFVAEPGFWLSHVHPVDAPKLFSKMRPLFEIGQDVHEYRFMHRDGSYRWVRDYVNLIRDEAGKAVQIVGCMLDIDEIKRYGLRKEEFYSMVSHDLKSPLVAIQGYSELIMEGDVPQEELMEMVSSINASCRKVLGLLGDFLDITRFEAGKMALHRQAVEVGRLLSELAAEMSVNAERKNLTVRVGEVEDMPQAELDERLVHRAVSNLMQNAINYTPKGGSITLDARLAVEEGSQFVVIEVSDTGIGIPREEHEEIFEMYYRSRRTAGGMRGSGIGLAIVRAVAEAHGGKVTLTSAVGEGSTFLLYLPVSSGED